MNYRLFLSIATAVAVCGCQHLNPSDSHPVLSKTFGPNKSDDVGEAIAITANRRVVIVMVKPRASDGKAGDWGKFCAEPPPDTALEQQSTIKAVFEATLKKPTTDGTAKGEFTSEELRFLSVLFQRSQGVQLFRDGLYSLCQLHANGALTDAEVGPLYKELLSKASQGIDSELKKQQAPVK